MTFMFMSKHQKVNNNFLDNAMIVKFILILDYNLLT